MAIAVPKLISQNESTETKLELNKKACDGGDTDGCFILGLMYHNGKGVKQNSQKALEFYDKACDMKDVKFSRALVNIIVSAYVDWYNLIFFDDKINNDSVLHIYCYRMKFTESSLKFVES
jgi:hypothetical protein